MNRSILIISILFVCSLKLQAQKFIARQGRIAFFSYTEVEHIKAENNQVLSIIDLQTGEIAVSMLMNAFIFEKALMREHFNESYVESDIYPKATFEGIVKDLNPDLPENQTRVIQGIFTMHGVSKELNIKVTIDEQDYRLALSGSFEAFVEDYDIKIPALLAGNIAKVITVDFNFTYEPYEE